MKKHYCEEKKNSFVLYFDLFEVISMKNIQSEREMEEVKEMK